jgi:hypothetical protein
LKRKKGLDGVLWEWQERIKSKTQEMTLRASNKTKEGITNLNQIGEGGSKL